MTLRHTSRARSVGATASANGEPEPRRRGKPVRKTLGLLLHRGDGLGARHVAFPALSALGMTGARSDALRHRPGVYLAFLATAG